MLQSGYLTISLSSSILCFSSTTGSTVSTIGSTGYSTGCFVILIFGVALDFDFGFALGWISSSLISSTIVSHTASFTGSSLLIGYSICSRVSSSDIFDYLYIILTK